jgi:type IV secretion system protein VirB2
MLCPPLPQDPAPSPQEQTSHRIDPPAQPHEAAARSGADVEGALTAGARRAFPQESGHRADRRGVRAGLLPIRDAGSRSHRDPAGASDLSAWHRRPAHVRNAWFAWLATWAALLPALASAGSPFATGAAATQTQLVAILTPLAAVAVMVSGVMAWFGRISWWWMVGVVLGTVLVFGGPQIVSWIRGMFGV